MKKPKFSTNSNEDLRNATRGPTKEFSSLYNHTIGDRGIFSAPESVDTKQLFDLLYNVMYPVFSYREWDIPHETKEQIFRSLCFLYLEHPNMSGLEYDAIRKYCTENTNLLEYGAGFSSFWLTTICKSVTSVEHNNLWFARLVFISKILNIDNLNLINSFQEDSNDQTFEGCQEKCEQYHNAVQYIDQIKGTKFDVVSIDGICRINCAKSVLSNITDDSVVIFSDFWRPKRHKERDYEMVFEWYDEVESCHEGNTFIVLKKKNNLSWV